MGETIPAVFPITEVTALTPSLGFLGSSATSLASVSSALTWRAQPCLGGVLEETTYASRYPSRTGEQYEDDGPSVKSADSPTGLENDTSRLLSL